jgi:hypothetical protein
MKLHVVPARTGLSWVRLGVRTFMRQPLALGGLFFLFMAVVSLLSALPLIGPALALVLVPGATLGLMAASREADAGRFPMPAILISAFRADPQRRNAMLVLGGAYTAALLLLMVLAVLSGSDSGTQVPPAAGEEVTPEALRAALAAGDIWWLFLLYLPVMAAFWHAPALVHWHGVSPVKAVFFSLMACWTNKAAMLLYMVGWTGLFAGAGLLLSLLGSLLGSATVLQAVLYPLVLLMAAMFHTSIWFTFRDSFIDDDDDPAPLRPGANDPA